MNIKDTIRRLHVTYLKMRLGFKPSAETKGNTLIIAPHPDDEVIGCGGLIARLVLQHRIPHVVVMTGGEGSHAGCCDTSKEDIVKARRRLTRNALTILGIPESHIHELNFADGNINGNDPEVKKLRHLVVELKPESVFVPHWGEGWPDHINTANIVRDIAPASAEIWEYCVWMWYYNVWRGLDWHNARRLSMSPEEHALKLKAMDAYVSPLAPCGKPWSGVLPRLFLKANSTNNELYFSIK